MVLCNQGCKTHVYISNGVPYNMSDNEPHEKTCRSLKIGKMWGGYYNTIPLDKIKAEIEEAFELALKAYRSNKIVDALTAIKQTVFALEYVKRQIKYQEEWNREQKALMAEDKTRIVANQTKDEERRNQKARDKQNMKIKSKADITFYTGDEMQ